MFQPASPLATLPPIPRRLRWIARLPRCIGAPLAAWLNPQDVFAVVSREAALVASLLRMGVLRSQGERDWMLLRAALLELPELVEVLVDQGANPDACLLHQSCATDVLMSRLYADGPTPDLVDMLKHFLRAGMSLDWRDASGWGVDVIASKWQVPDLFDRPRSDLAHAALQSAPHALQPARARRL